MSATKAVAATVGLLIAAACCAAELKIDGPASVPRDRFVEVRATGDIKGAGLIWDVSPEQHADTREVPGGLLLAAPPGTYQIKLRSVRLVEGAMSIETARHTVVVIDPTPPTPPQPPTPPTPLVPPQPPGPPPTPAPIPGQGLRVLVVYETATVSKLPPAQQAIIYGRTVRDYLNATCPEGPDGKTREWRIYDADVDTSGESATWQGAMKRPRSSLPWLIVSNGTTGFEGPLPATADEALAIFKKFAEAK